MNPLIKESEYSEYHYKLLNDNKLSVAEMEDCIKFQPQSNTGERIYRIKMIAALNKYRDNMEKL
jgi:hypothetical protein